MARKRITQADVAQRAGVSQTAVSQILGTSGSAANFRSETRQKVLEAARELGYVPNSAARALRTNRTMTIGVVVGFITDELALRITHGIQEVAYERGYGLLIADTEQNHDREVQVLKQFHDREVDGLILVDSWNNPETLLTDDSYPPAIFAQLRHLTGPHNSVGCDGVRSGYEATRHLLDLGYRKVAHISGPDFWPSAVERIKGYKQALEDYDIPYDADLVEAGDWEIISGIEAASALLDRSPDIDAIFVSNDLMAAGVIQEAARRGLRVPQDIALVGYDDRYLAEALLPPLTTFSLPLNDIGQKAAYLLIDRLLRKNARRVPSMTVAGRMVVRASCGALSVSL